MSTKSLTTVEAYLAALPADRRAELESVRRVILKALPKGYAEGMQYGMIGYFVPHELYPEGYHCNPAEPLPFISLGAQKRHLSLSMFCLYGDETELGAFQEAWAETGKKLDMGKSCIRFRAADDLALDLIARTVRGIKVRAYVASYENGLPPSVRKKRLAKKTEAKKTEAKKTGSKKTGSKKTGVTKAVTKKAVTRTAASKTAGSKTAGSKKAVSRAAKKTA